MTRILLRCDAGSAVGHGHWMRCLSIADALRSHGVDTVLAVCSDTSLERSGAVMVPAGLRGREAVEATLRLVGPVNATLIDLFDLSPDEIADWRARVPVLACIDDASGFMFDCDLLINPNLAPSFEHRRSSRVSYMSGRDAVLLRPEFRALPPREVTPSAERLLICFGGSDTCGLLPRLAMWLEEGEWPDRPANIEVVVGPAVPEGRAIAARLDRLAGVSAQVGASDMAQSMMNADRGLFSAGTLLYEALASGLPSLFVAANAAEAREAAFVAGEKAGLFLGLAVEATARQIMAGLAELEPQTARQAMARRAQALIDGQGVNRVAARLARLAQGGAKA